MKYLLIWLAGVVLSIDANAQNNEKTITGNTIVTLEGVVQDSTSLSLVAGATIKISFNRSDKSMVSDAGGRFIVTGLPLAGKYTILISAIGYKTSLREVTMPYLHYPETVIKNVGIVKLWPVQNMLAGVVVKANTTPAMQFGIDKKIFNVEKNITAQGGTAVDVMKNIPSLSVDVDGNVEMRNSAPQILIDGRPTILTLDQVPADDIEKVELITNPSAKYDASSAGGVINIILKKNKRVGFNGIASIGAGTPGIFNSNLNLNVRQKKFNFFVSGNYRRTGGNVHEETYRINKNDGAISDYFQQSSDNKRANNAHSVRFGLDYFLNNKSTLSFTQNFNSGRFDNTALQHQQYLDSDKKPQYTGVRTTSSLGTFNRSSSHLGYEKKLGGPDDKFTADITYNHGSNNNQSRIFNNLYNLDGSDYSPATQVYNSGDGHNYQVTAQADYSKKKDDKRVEFGIRAYYSSNRSNFGTHSVDHANNPSKLPLGNNYKYTERTEAGYFNYANKWKSITYQVGLRVELSKFDGTLIDSNVHFGYTLPDGFNKLGYALFPSIFLTKALSDNQELQFNYSKRIRRPRFWEINPYVDINDPLNIRKGNPALRPEYTNSFELNYFNRFKNNGGSFLAVVYFKNNVGDVTQFSDTISTALYHQLNNAAVSPDAILNTYINAGYTNRVGAEFTLQKKITKHLDVMYNVDMAYRKTNASINNVNLNNDGFNFQNKLITNYATGGDAGKFFKDISMQLVGNYQGPRVIPQGHIQQQFSADFALRKDFLKNKAASLSFSINDIFNSRKFGTVYDTDEFYQDAYRRWDTRAFRITLSYKFGDTSFDLFRKKRPDNNERDNEEM